MRNWLLALAICAAPLAAAAQEAPGAAPGINLNTPQQAHPTMAPPTPIRPSNTLEWAFVRAFNDPAQRPVFRRELLDQHIAMPTASSAPNAAPLEFDIGEGRRATMIFTSAARLDQVLGHNAPRQVMTGRAAFERLRGRHVVLNPQLVPMLTLEPEDLVAYLAAPVPRSLAGPAQ